MAEERYSGTCSQCGSYVQAADRFCGVCGAKRPTKPQEATSVQQTAGPPRAPKHTSGRSGRRKRVLVVAVGALLVLLAVSAAVAYAALSSGTNLLGWAGSQTPGTEEDTPEEQDPPSDSETSQDPSTTTAYVSADAPPDPAFDKLLPELERRAENVNLMLPAELPSVLKNVAVNRDLEGDGYGIAFFREP